MNRQVLSTEDKIRGFAARQPGWCYRGGDGFAANTIESAIQIEKNMREIGILETDAFPGPEGEIRVTAYCGADYYEFTVNPNLVVEYIHEQNAPRNRARATQARGD